MDAASFGIIRCSMWELGHAYGTSSKKEEIGVKPAIRTNRGQACDFAALTLTPPDIAS
jgi:hypothetical protein